jgi:hypothetical protein
MDKEFVPYQEAFELKKLGFNEECFWWYGFEKYLRKDRIGTSTNYSYFLENKSCSAPLYSQAFRWFRENHNMSGEVGINVMEDDEYCYEIGDVKTRTTVDEGSYKTYEEAELACLKKLIEIVKNNE